MFGHQNTNDQANAGHLAPTADDALGAPGPETISPSPESPVPAVNDQPADYGTTPLPHAAAPEPVASQPAATPPLTPAAPAHTGVTAPADADDLLSIKQSALQELSPLIGHLEQSPEEKFRTTMMMIQASDDHSMLKTAFESARHIADDKARAQALLDVINEINYFTQQHNG